MLGDELDFPLPPPAPVPRILSLGLAMQLDPHGGREPSALGDFFRSIEVNTVLGDEEMVNIDRICKLLADDWGFCYTVTTNLRKISEYTKNLEGLQEGDRNDVLSKIDQLKNAIESSPKSLSWKMRAKVQ
jgi:hypothetical protein